MKYLALFLAIVWGIFLIFLVSNSHSQEQIITFAWDYPNPPADLKEFRVLSATTPGGPYTQIASMPYTTGSQTAYTYPASVPAPAGRETLFYFVAVAVDLKGNVSPYSNEIPHLFDFAPPDPVINFMIRFTPSQP